MHMLLFVPAPMSYDHVLIPMRAQPLHYGHVNLLVALSSQYNRWTILLSGHHDHEQNPYSFSLRKKRLVHIFSLYWCPFSIQPLPTFPSPAHSIKSVEEVNAIQNKFMAIWWTNFVIISGNQHVINLCRHTYRFPCLSLEEDIRIERTLPNKNPFTKFENNGSFIRSLIHTKQFALLRDFVPVYVLDDIIS